MDVIELSIYPFFRCNYRCIYCYLNNEDLQSREILNIKLLKKLLERLKNTKLKVEILGGEPLLKPKFISGVLDILSKYNIESLKISTNLTLIDEERINLLKRFDEIQVSLDAADEKMYKKIRGGNFKKVIENINLLNSEGINISISFVLLKLNYYQIENFFKLAKDLGIRKINIGYFIPAGRGREIRQLSLSIEEIEKVSDKIDKLEKIYGIETYSSLLRKVENKLYFCHAGNKKFSMLPNGCIVPCIFFREICLGKGSIEKLILIKNNYTICPAFYPLKT